MPSHQALDVPVRLHYVLSTTPHGVTRLISDSIACTLCKLLLFLLQTCGATPQHHSRNCCRHCMLWWHSSHLQNWGLHVHEYPGCIVRLLGCWCCTLGCSRWCVGGTAHPCVDWRQPLIVCWLVSFNANDCMRCKRGLPSGQQLSRNTSATTAKRCAYCSFTAKRVPGGWLLM